MIGVMLVSRRQDVTDILREYAKSDAELEIVAEATGGETALEKVENTSPDVLVIYSENEEADSISLAERIIKLKPRTFVILLTEEFTVEELQRANAVGCHNVMALPDDGKAFCDEIHRVYNTESGRIAALDTNQRVVWQSKVITVFSAKGGLGKTTISTNLAIKLAEKNKKVALIDLDLQFGDVNIFMDIDSKETIADIVQDVDFTSIDSVRSYMTVHPSGVHVISAPKSPEYADVITGDKIQSLLGLLRSYYDYVIVDTATDFSDSTLSALEASSLILFITGLDISILKNSKIAMEILESLGQKKKVRTIINRAIEINSISTADVQRIVDAPILSRIPSDYMMAVAALNRGQPFVESAPKAKLSLAIADIADKIMNGADNFDIQQLTPRERKALLKKYKTKEKYKS